MASRLATAYMAIRADKQLFRKDLDAIKKMAQTMLRGIKVPASLTISKASIARDMSAAQKVIAQHLKSVPFTIDIKANVSGLDRVVKDAQKAITRASRTSGRSTGGTTGGGGGGGIRGGAASSADPAKMARKEAAEVKKILQSIQTPYERYAERMRTLQRHMLAGRMSIPMYARAGAAEWDKYQSQLAKVAAQAKKAAGENGKLSVEARRFAAEARKVTASVMTPYEQYQTRMARLQKLMMSGALSPEAFARAGSRETAKWHKAEAAQGPTLSGNAAASSSQWIDATGRKYAGLVRQMSRNVATPRLNLGPIGSDLSKLHTMFKVSFARIAEVAAGIGMAELVRHTFGAIRAFGTALVTTNADLERYNTSLRVMLGSGSAAKKMFDDLRKFAIETAFDFPGAVKGAQRLLRAGFSAEEVLPVLRDVGDAAAVSPDGLQFAVERITYALGQMRALGKVSAQDMRQLAEAGIPAWKFLAESMGTSVQEVMKLSEQGAIASDEGIRAILGGIQRNFGGAQAEWAKTFSGMWEILKENISRGMETIGAGPFENIKIAIGDMIDWTGSEEGQAVIAQLASTMRELADGALAAFQALQSYYAGVTAIGEAFLSIIHAVFAPFSESLGSLSWWFKGIIDLIHVFSLGIELAALSVKAFFDTISFRGPDASFKALDKWKKRAMGEMPSERMDRLAREREAKKERDANRKKQPVTPRPPKNVVGGEFAKWQQQQKAMFGVAVTGQEQSEQASAREEFTKNLLKTYDSLKDAEPGDRVAKLREELERMAAVGIDPRQYAEMSRAINMIDAQTKFNNAAQASQDFRDKLRDMRIEMGAATEGQKMLADAIAKGVPPEALVRLRQLAAEFDAVKRVSEMVGEFKSLQEEMRKLGREASETIRAQQIRADMRAAGYGEKQIDATIRQDKALRSQAEAWRTFGDAMKTTLTPMQQFDKAVRLLDTLLRGHKITIEDYRKAVGNLRAELSKSAKSEARTPAGELLEKINEYNKMVGKDGLTKEERDSLVRRAKGRTLGWTVKDAEEEYLYERQKAMEAHKKNPELFTSRDYDRAVDIARRERDQRMMEAAQREAIAAQAEEQLKKLNSLKERGRISEKDYRARSEEILRRKDVALARASGQGKGSETIGLAEQANRILMATMGGEDKTQRQIAEYTKAAAKFLEQVAANTEQMKNNGNKPAIAGK